MSSLLEENETSKQNMRTNMKPNPSIEEVYKLITLHWKACKDIIRSSIKQIESYDDANFYLEVKNDHDSFNDNRTSYLIKFYNAMETKSGSDLLNGLGAMLQCINDNLKINIQVPTIVSPSSNNAYIFSTTNANFIMMNDCKVQDGSMQTVAVRVFKWIHGTTLSRIQPDFLHMYQLGQAIGAVSQCLVGFIHPAFHRTHMWDLAQFESYDTMKYLDYVDDEEVKLCISNNYRVYMQQVLPVANQLPRSVIMADCNDANVIVSTPSTNSSNTKLACSSEVISDHNSSGGVYRVVGLIDFSDAVETWSCNEIAIAMAYSLLTSYGKQSPYHAMGGLFLGHILQQHQLILTSCELACLPVLIMIRLSMSVMIGAYAISKEPHNEYLKLHSIPGKEAIKWLSNNNNTNNNNSSSNNSSLLTQFFTILQEQFLQADKISEELTTVEDMLNEIIQSL